MTSRLQRSNHLIRPNCILGPIVGQPPEGGFIAPHLDVATRHKSIQFLAVTKQAPTNCRALTSGGFGINLGNRDKACDRVHRTEFGNFTGYVNGILTGRISSYERSNYRIMLSDVLNRIHQRLAALGKSGHSASKEAGLSSDAIRNLERAVREGRRSGVSTKTIAALAPVLQTSVAWLLEGEGTEEATSETVPVVGYVSAGAELALYDQGQGPFDYVTPPRDSKPTTVAARVQGVSLGPLFDDALIFYNSVQSPITPELHGKLCVAGLEDGRVVVKQLMPGDGGRYHLLSNSAEPPLFNEAVLWAAKVTDIRPR